MTDCVEKWQDGALSVPNVRGIWKSTSIQIQDGGCSLKCRCNWAASRSYVGTWDRYGPGEVAQVLTVTYREILGVGPLQILNV